MQQQQQHNILVRHFYKSWTAAYINWQSENAAPEDAEIKEPACSETEDTMDEYTVSVFVLWLNLLRA